MRSLDWEQSPFSQKTSSHVSTKRVLSRNGKNFVKVTHSVSKVFCISSWTYFWGGSCSSLRDEISIGPWEKGKVDIDSWVDAWTLSLLTILWRDWRAAVTSGFLPVIGELSTAFSSTSRAKRLWACVVVLPSKAAGLSVGPPLMVSARPGEFVVDLDERWCEVPSRELRDFKACSMPASLSSIPSIFFSYWFEMRTLCRGCFICRVVLHTILNVIAIYVFSVQKWAIPWLDARQFEHDGIPVRWFEFQSYVVSCSLRVRTFIAFYFPSSAKITLETWVLCSHNGGWCNLLPASFLPLLWRLHCPNPYVCLLVFAWCSRVRSTDSADNEKQRDYMQPATLIKFRDDD